MNRRQRFLGLSCLVWSLAGSVAHADPLPLEARVRIGSPARELAASVRPGGGGTIVSVGTKQHTLPISDAREARVEVVSLPHGGDALLVRIDGTSEKWVALLGGRSGGDLLISGRSDLHGDPGERRALVVETSEPDAAGRRSVTVGQRHEGVALCGGAPILLDPRVLSPRTLALEPSPRTELTTMQAQPGQAQPVEGESAAPMLAALTVAGSTVLDATTQTPQLPRPLLDGDPATTWEAPPGAVALFRGTLGSANLDRLEITLPERRRPTELVLLGDGGRALRVQIPLGPERVAIPLSPAWPSKCLALVIGGDAKSEDAVGIGEVVAYTEADRAGGIDGLVAKVVQDGDDAGWAVDVLATLGRPAAVAVAQRYDALSARGQRRVLPMLTRALEEPTVRDAVLKAARSEDASFAQATLSAIGAVGEKGKPLLRELVMEPNARGDEAAKLLAKDASELPALLAALGHEGGADRPVLRRLLATLGKRAPKEVAAEAERWLAAGPSVSAQAGLALALAHLTELAPLVQRMADTSLSKAEGFPDRYRFALALEHTAPTPTSDAWLAAQAQGAEEWMMRHAAFKAIAARNAAQAQTLAPTVAADAYPRVRALALPVLAKGPDVTPVERVLATDTWPPVRVAAVRALEPHRSSGPKLRAALDDSSRSVRAAAIDALAAQHDTDAWPAIAPHLTAPSEWPVVQTAAIRAAARLCRADAREPLEQLARRALRPDAQENDQSLGLEALAALHALGGEAAREAKLMATREGAPPGLKAAFERLPPPSCGSGKQR